jgi:ribonucleoside-diphosphate reductase alpha chain
MKNKITLLIFSLMISMFSFSQNLTLDWVKQIGGLNDQIVNDFSIDTQKNIYSTGSFYGNVDIDPSLNTSILSSNGNEEYILGVDVARSQDSSNNQTSVAIIEIKRNRNRKINYLNLVNLISISNTLDFSAQALELKKIKKTFNAKVCILDTNGLGVGLADFLMKESFDPNTGESFGCWDTINTEAQPEVRDAERCLYDLKPQSANSDIIVAFIDMVESGKLRLLEKKQNTDYDLKDKENHIENVLPFVQTDFLVEEIANLQLKPLPSGKITVDKVIKRYNKDRFSALAYALWYIKTYEDNTYVQDEDEMDLLMRYSFF